MASLTDYYQDCAFNTSNKYYLLTYLRLCVNVKNATKFAAVSDLPQTYPVGNS